MGTYILALDQGTTSSRAIVFDRLGDIVSKAQYPFRQLYPQAGWVEHDPMEIWETERRAAAQAAEGLEADIAGIGVTNQRETTILWDKVTGRPVYNAIVAVPPHGGAVRGAEAPGAGGARPVRHRPADRRLLLRHQDPLGAG